VRLQAEEVFLAKSLDNAAARTARVRTSRQEADLGGEWAAQAARNTSM
jgi:hypothetical protein